MSDTYHIYLIYEDQADWESILFQTLEARLKHFPDTENWVKIHRNPKLSDLHDNQNEWAIAILLGSVAFSNSNYCQEMVEALISTNTTIIPVVEDENEFHEHIMERLHHINAFIWKSPKADDLLTNEILEILDITDQNRKVFISYRRTDGINIAEQLFDGLHRRRFDVYKDNYSIHVGTDFQKRLFEALEEKAFLVLIESPEVHESTWVEEEITYAREHHMGIIVLRWADNSNPMEIAKHLPSITLHQTDFVSPGDSPAKLSSEKLEEVIQAIHDQHVQALFKRREFTIGSLLKTIQHRNFPYIAFRDWKLMINTPKSQADILIGVSARIPKTKDFYYLEERGKAYSKLEKCLVHQVESFAEEHREVLSWVEDLSDIQLISLDDILLSL